MKAGARWNVRSLRTCGRVDNQAILPAGGQYNPRRLFSSTCSPQRARSASAMMKSLLSLADLLSDGPISVDTDRLVRSRRRNDGAPGVFSSARIPAGSLLAVIPTSCIVAPATLPATLGTSTAKAIHRSLLPGSNADADVNIVTCATAFHLLRATTTAAPVDVPGILSGGRFVDKYLMRITSDCDVVANRQAAASSFRADVTDALARHHKARTPEDLQRLVDDECSRYGRLAHYREQHLTHLRNIVHSVLAGADTPCDLDHMVDVAHGLCESRSVAIANGALALGGGVGDQGVAPHGDDDDDDDASNVGGPALVPFADLVNHKTYDEPNVTIACITDVDEIEQMLRIISRRRLMCAHACHTEVDAMLTASQQQHTPLLSSASPAVVVVVAATNIERGQELHYQYVQGTDAADGTTASLHPTGTSLAEWALRFHFLP